MGRMRNCRQALGSPTYATFVVGAALFTDVFFYDMIVPVLPRILKERVSVPNNRVQLWMSASLSIFGVVQVLSPPLIGAWIDWLRIKSIPFLLGLVVMFAASLLLFLGTSVPVIMTARALQGLSGSMVFVAGFTLLGTYHNAKGVGTAMGFALTGVSFGELLGPLLSGIMYDQVGHWGVFVLALTILVIDGILRLLLRSPKGESETSSGDERSPLLQQDGQQDFNDRSAQGSNDASHLNSAASQSKSLTFKKLVLSTNCILSILALIAIASIRAALESVLAIYTAYRFGLSSTGIGLLLVGFLVPSLLSPLVAGIVEKRGPRIPCAVANFILAGCAIGLALVRGDSTFAFILFTGFIILAGISAAILMPGHMVAVSVYVSKRASDDADMTHVDIDGKLYGLLSMAISLGLFAGPLFTIGFPAHYSWSTMCYCTSGLAVAFGVASIVSWRQWITEDE